MIDGTYTYYTIQHRKTHESDWCDPNGPLKKVPNEKWALSSWDYFPIEPWHGSGNDYRPKYRDSYDQSRDVWQKTDSYGWWDASYAINAMVRLTEASENNEFKHKDGYGVIHQSYKYEFRIVAVTVSQKVEELTIKHIIEKQKCEKALSN